MMPGVRKGLSRSRVVVAALAIVDRDGPESLTMRALGRELGVDPMAVYHYVPGKSALYDALAEAVWAEVELPARTGEWEADLVALARGVRRALLAHPRALPVVATRQSVAPATLDLLETGIAILVEAGLPPAVALSLMGAASALLVGSALTEVGVAPDEAAETAPDALAAAVGGAEPSRPHLAAAIQPGVPTRRRRSRRVCRRYSPASAHCGGTVDTGSMTKGWEGGSAPSAEASSPSCPSVALRCPAGPDGESRGQQRRSRGSVVRLEELAKGTRVRGISAAGW